MADGEHDVTVRYHKVVANWTRVLAVFTLVLAGASVVQSYLMLRASQDTRDMFIASQRPVLSYSDKEPISFSLVRGSDGAVSLVKIAVRLDNTGNSNAIVKKWTMVRCVSPCDGDAAFDFAQKVLSSESVVGAKSHIITEISFYPWDIPSQSDAKDKSFFLIYYEYSDSLGSDRHYRYAFCERFWLRDGVDINTISGDDQNWNRYFGSDQCNANNYAD